MENHARHAVSVLPTFGAPLMQFFGCSSLLGLVSRDESNLFLFESATDSSLAQKYPSVRPFADVTQTDGGRFSASGRIRLYGV